MTERPWTFAEHVPGAPRASRWGLFGGQLSRLPRHVRKDPEPAGERSHCFDQPHQTSSVGICLLGKRAY